MSRNETGCYRCGDLGHWADTCPLLTPAASEAEHMSRIRLYVDRWVEGHLGIEQKRVAISLENEMWYGRGKCPKNLIYP